MYRPKEEEKVMVRMGKGEAVVGTLKHVQPGVSMAVIRLADGQILRCPLYRVRPLSKPEQKPVIPTTMQEAQTAVGHLYHHIDTERLPLLKRFLRKMKFAT